MLTEQWHRSTRCSSGGCLVARHVGVVEVADSKDPLSPVLRFGSGVWAEFVAAIRHGEFGDLR